MRGSGSGCVRRGRRQDGRGRLWGERRWRRRGDGRRRRCRGRRGRRDDRRRAHGRTGRRDGGRRGSRARRGRGDGRRLGRRRLGRRTARGQQAERVDVAFVLRRDPDAEVDTRGRMLRVAARAHRPDGRAFVDHVALRGRDRPEVDERDRVAVGREDRHAASVGGERARERDGPGRGRPDGQAVAAADVDSPVLSGGVRVGAERERAQHGSVGGPRPGKRRAARHERDQPCGADHEETVHKTPPSFSARATRVCES